MKRPARLTKRQAEILNRLRRCANAGKVPTALATKNLKEMFRALSKSSA